MLHIYSTISQACKPLKCIWERLETLSIHSFIFEPFLKRLLNRQASLLMVNLFQNLIAMVNDCCRAMVLCIIISYLDIAARPKYLCAEVTMIQNMLATAEPPYKLNTSPLYKNCKSLSTWPQQCGNDGGRRARLSHSKRGNSLRTNTTRETLGSVNKPRTPLNTPRLTDTLKKEVAVCMLILLWIVLEKLG